MEVLEAGRPLHCKINAIPFDFLLSRRRSSANAVLPREKKNGAFPEIREQRLLYFIGSR